MKLSRLVLLYHFLLMLGMTTGSASTQVRPFQSPPRPLVLNQQITATLQPGERHSYEIELQQGQFFEVSGQSDEMIMGFTLNDNNGVLVGMTGVQPKQPALVAYVVPATRRYRVFLHSNDTVERRYTMQARVLPSATPGFLALAESLRNEHQVYKQMFTQRTKDSIAATPELAERTAAQCAQLGNLRCQAGMLNMVGEAWRLMTQMARAIDAYERGLVVARQIGLHDKAAEITTFVGLCHYHVGNYRQALRHYAEAMPQWEANPATSFKPYNMMGWTTVLAGHAHLALGELAQAETAFEQAHELYRQYHEIHHVVEEWRSGQTEIKRGLSRIAEIKGDKQRALDLLTEAIHDNEHSNTTYFLPVWLNAVGNLYASLGDTTQARAAYERALALEKRMGSQATAGETIYLLGRLHQLNGELDAAAGQYEQALVVLRATQTRRHEARVLQALGELNALRERWTVARAQYEAALALQTELEDQVGKAQTLTQLGAAQLALGNRSLAQAHLQAALALGQTLGQREGEAATRYQMARLARAQNDWTGARTQMEIAVQLIEQVRASVFNLDLRTSYMDTVQGYYEFYIDTLMQTGGNRTPSAKVATNEASAAAALQISERARARSMLETLMEAQADIRSGIAPALLAAERAAQTELRAKGEYQLRLHTLPAKAELRAQAAREVQAALAAYQSVQARIRQASPRYAALTQPQPLKLSELQTQLLDARTVLLEYALGETRSYLWVVTQEALHSYELPPRAVIERAARRVYDALTARNHTLPNEAGTARRERIARADQEFTEAAATLSQMILAPAAVQLGTHRLLICAQGALQLIPFAVLPDPAAAAAKPSATYLLEQHEIVTLPSATMLAMLRREFAGRTPAPHTLAVLADPVFNLNDERFSPSVFVTAKAAATSAQTPQLSQTPQRWSFANALADVRGNPLPAGQRKAAQTDAATLARLLGTSWEAERISALVPAAARMQALGFAASRTTATSVQLSEYRVLHFATHALLNTVHPELSGMILSLYQEDGQPQEGFLPTHEIYNLNLPAELVVLSACQTGLGKQVRSEGLLGLPQAFLYAGTRRVLVSQWALQDQATAAFIAHFYQRILGTNPLPPAAALRAAQLAMLRSRRWPAPFFWAGFTLHGEWN